MKRSWLRAKARICFNTYLINHIELRDLLFLKTNLHKEKLFYLKSFLKRLKKGIFYKKGLLVNNACKLFSTTRSRLCYIFFLLYIHYTDIHFY